MPSAPQPFGEDGADSPTADPLAGQPDFDLAIPRTGRCYGKHVLDHRWPDARADRSGTLHRQSIVGQAGLSRSPPPPPPLGARVTLVSGPVHPADAARASTASTSKPRVEMGNAVKDALPADVGIMVAAVADWRTARTSREEKIKKRGSAPPALLLTENPDILATDLRPSQAAAGC